MIQKKIHIVCLVLFQLLVFVAPHFIQATHFHTFEQHRNPAAANGFAFSKAAKGCPICKFEFVPTIANDEPHYCLFQPATQVKNTESVHQVFKQSFSFCLLRAPPIA